MHISYGKLLGAILGAATGIWLLVAAGVLAIPQDDNPPTVRELTNQMWTMQNTLDACCEQLTRPDGEFRESFEEYVRLRKQLQDLELRVEFLEGAN